MRRRIQFEKWENPYEEEEFDSLNHDAVVQKFIDENFKMWILHSNFDLDTKVIDLLWDLDGIEIIEPLTRYRLKIAFGKLFDENDVKHQINRLLLFADHQQLPLTEDLKGQVDKAYEILQDYPFWAIMVLPNGKMETAYAKGYDPKFDRTYELYRETQRAVGAYVDGYDDQVRMGSLHNNCGRNNGGDSGECN